MLYVINTCLGTNILQKVSPLGLDQWNQGRKGHDDHILQVSIVLAIENVDLGVEILLSISDPASPKYGQHLEQETWQPCSCRIQMLLVRSLTGLKALEYPKPG